MNKMGPESSASEWEGFDVKAVILNGSLPGKDDLFPIQRILEEELSDASVSLDTFVLRELNIRSCIGCYRCWDTTPGECFQKDDAPEIVKEVIRSGLVVFLTPLTFGAYSSELKKIIERMLGLLQPGQCLHNGETHHIKRYDRYPSVLAIALTDNRDVEEIRIFRKLGERHSLNFYPPRYKYEVFDSKEGNGEIREKIRHLLVEMEIKV